MSGSTRFLVPALMGQPGQPKAWFTIRTSIGSILPIFRLDSLQHREFTKIAEAMLKGSGERLGGIVLEFDNFEQVAAQLFEIDPTLRGTNLIAGDGPEARAIMEEMKSTPWIGFDQEGGAS